MSTSFDNTKIVATVGPASNSKEKLLELVVAGVDVFRLNFSHGTHEQHKQVIDHINDINRTFDYNVSILQDLQGPKIRIGEVENNGVEIVEGQEFTVTTEQMVGTSEMASTSYTAITRDVKPGDAIMIDDGKLELRVHKIDGPHIKTRVVYGGTLKSRKGMNLPDTDISEPSLTKKDKEDLEFGLTQSINWVALSFVRSAGDIVHVQNIIKEKNLRIKVIAKIERPEAIKNIDAIIKVADGIMVARGDLGIEVLMAEVPMIQKMLVQKCNQASKPVIIATQMMESMIESPRPTRAEVNDVANAVVDGADAVMLSAETAAGKYPVETIQHMSNIIRSVEKDADIYYRSYKLKEKDIYFASEIIIDNACRMAKAVNAKAIIGMTNSGFTATRIARHRPKADIFIFTSNKELLKILNLVWGVRAFYYNKMISTDQSFSDLEQFLVKAGLLRQGDYFVNTGSMPLEEKRKTNMVKISRVE